LSRRGYLAWSRYNMVKNPDERAAQKSLEVIIELYQLLLFLFDPLPAIMITRTRARMRMRTRHPRLAVTAMTAPQCAVNCVTCVIPMCACGSHCDVMAYGVTCGWLGRYRRKLWADARTANVIATAAFSQATKQRVTALSFFLHVDDQRAAEAAAAENDSDSSDDESQPKQKDLLSISKQQLLDIRKKEGKGVKR
jgi:hypothetical protein